MFSAVKTEFITPSTPSPRNGNSLEHHRPPKTPNGLLNALNEACKQPAVNLQIAQVYLQHSDPDFAKRTWQHVMDEMGKTKSGSTKNGGTLR